MVDQDPVTVTTVGRLIDALDAHVKHHRRSLPGQVTTRPPAGHGDGTRAPLRRAVGTPHPKLVRDGQGVECHLSCRCSGGVGPRCAQISDQRGVVGLNAVDGLARARTEVDDGLPIRERYNSPLRAKERPALQLANQVLPPWGHGSDRVSTRGYPSAQARSSTASGTGCAGAISKLIQCCQRFGGHRGSSQDELVGLRAAASARGPWS